MEILIDSNTKGSNSHGYVTVRTRSKPSYKLREQGHFPSDGVFDIEADALTIVPPRSDEVPSVPRHNRLNRIAARLAYQTRNA